MKSAGSLRLCALLMLSYSHRCEVKELEASTTFPFRKVSNNVTEITPETMFVWQMLIPLSNQAKLNNMDGGTRGSTV